MEKGADKNNLASGHRNTEKPKRYYVFADGKFSEMEVNRGFFESNPVLWSARLSTGLFGLTSCPAGNRGPKNSNEVILGVGDEGLRELIKLGFVPCPVCQPEKSQNFSWLRVENEVSAKYGLSSTEGFSDKTRLPFDSRRVDWERVIGAIHGVPSRIYLPEGLAAEEVKSFRDSIQRILRDNGVAADPVLGYYDQKTADHFTEYHA